MEEEKLISLVTSAQPPSIIKVFGIGGGGSNAVNHMSRLGIKDVEFVVCNTDSQALSKSPVALKIQLGKTLTEGLGAGNSPGQGKQAAIESLEDIVNLLSENTKMIFITAGMGGGTGTGAAPVIAKTAKEMGLLTIAIVTIPFRFEGPRRFNQAIEGLRELKEHVDSLLVINNEKLREIYGDLAVSEAFAKADDVLTIAAKGIAEVITVPGHVNVDFADVKTVMSESGVAIMGSGKAEGENRAIESIKMALSSPLLNNNEIRGARNVLLNITSGTKEITMDEMVQISEFVQDAAGMKADMIFGSCKDESLGDFISVTIIATGFGASTIPELNEEPADKRKIIQLDSEKQRETSRVVNPARNTTEQLAQRTFEFDVSASNAAADVTEKKSGRASDRAMDNPIPDLNDPKVIDKLENIPAYVRREMKIEDKNYSSASDYSKLTITEKDNNFTLKENNPYLHDNVD